MRKYRIMEERLKRNLDEVKKNVSQKLISWFKVESDYVDKLLKDI